LHNGDLSTTKATSDAAISVQKLNLREIAKRARVSTATVSRAINHIPTVNPYLAKRVWKVVEDLGYYPNTQARALVSGHSRIFGLIVSELTNSFFAEVVEAFESLAVQHGYEILLSSTADDLRRMELVIRRMIERRVDGVAALTFSIEESIIRDLSVHNIPVVLLDGTSQIPGISRVCIDYENGIRQAVQHLAALRHGRIAFVGGPEHATCAQVRKRAFQQAMAEIGLEAPQELIVPSDQSAESGMDALRELWRLPARPTAILCSNDLTATGVLAEAYQCGISVPHQLSVVGFDDIRPAQFTAPPLTTVRISQTDLAIRAFQMLTNHDKTLRSSDEYMLKTSLVLRRSTALQPRTKVE
jgi:LacI family transcriptional regulator